MAAPDKVSPLAVAFPELPPVAGVGLATAATGDGYRGRDDTLLMSFAPGTRAAGVQTLNAVCGWPVSRNRGLLPVTDCRGLLVQAGIADVFTGQAGEAAMQAGVTVTAQALGCAPTAILTAATGVIGLTPATTGLVRHLPAMAEAAGHAATPDSWYRAALAIGTTDTFPKGATAHCTLGGATVRINGIAKGSGMIAPNMATMLAFITTDAALPADQLQSCIAAASQQTFNCVTVDGDTSTSDMALAFATGAAGNPWPASIDAAELAEFRAGLEAVCGDLAQQIARDGEGAEKLITVRVTGAGDAASARRIAATVANSPLVKTAVAGADPNWGRVVMAVGRSGEPIAAERLAVAFGGITVAREGTAVPEADAAALTAHLRGREVEIDIDVGVGHGTAHMWTCDLTDRYIAINAEYRS